MAALIGAVVVLATRCLTPDEAYDRMEWKSLILIASMLSFGQAMLETGTAKYVAGLLVAQVEGANPVWLLAGFFAITVALTQPMSNQAAAVVIFSGRRRDGHTPRAESKIVCHDDRYCRKLLLPDSAGALLPDGLQRRTLPVYGFREGRLAPDRHHLRHCYSDGAAPVAS